MTRVGVVGFCNSLLWAGRKTNAKTRPRRSAKVTNEAVAIGKKLAGLRRMLNEQKSDRLLHINLLSALLLHKYFPQHNKLSRAPPNLSLPKRNVQ